MLQTKTLLQQKECGLFYGDFRLLAIFSLEIDET